MGMPPRTPLATKAPAATTPVFTFGAPSSGLAAPNTPSFSFGTTSMPAFGTASPPTSSPLGMLQPQLLCCPSGHPMVPDMVGLKLRKCNGAFCKHGTIGLCVARLWCPCGLDLCLDCASQLARAQATPFAAAPAFTAVSTAQRGQTGTGGGTAPPNPPYQTTFIREGFGAPDRPTSVRNALNARRLTSPPAIERCQQPRLHHLQCCVPVLCAHALRVCCARARLLW